MKIRATLATFVVMMIVLAHSATGESVFIIDDTGNAASPFSNTADPEITWDQTVGGLDTAIFHATNRLAGVTVQSGTPRPLLGNNNILSAELYVTQTDVDGCSQGMNFLKLKLRNPDGGAQQDVAIGGYGGAGGSGIQWFPASNVWTTFTYDLTQESWWIDDYSAWEIYRVYMYENNDPNYNNTYGIRNFKFTEAPTIPTGTVLIVN